MQDLRVTDERVSALKLLQRAFSQGSKIIEHFLRWAVLFITQIISVEPFPMYRILSSTVSCRKNDRLMERLWSPWCLVILPACHYSQDGALEKLVGLLSETDAKLQIESVWCVANITAGDHEHCLKVAQRTAPYMITYLSGDNIDVQVPFCLPHSLPHSVPHTLTLSCPPSVLNHSHLSLT